MPRRASGLPFAVSLSTRGALMPAWMVQHVAATARVDGIDVDATSPIAAWLGARSGITDHPHVPVRSLWVPAEAFLASRIQRLIQTSHERQPEASPLVILLTPGNASIKELSRTFHRANMAPETWRMAIGVPSTALRGGRPHLVHMGGLRRFAEEWEVPLALDLTGRFDPTWEAEAAISRIGNRLAMLRVTASAPSRGAIGRDRVACRALHAAIDRAHQLDIAVASGGGIPFPVTPRAAAKAAERAAIYIDERALAHVQALREGIDHLQDSPSRRGP